MEKNYVGEIPEGYTKVSLDEESELIKNSNLELAQKAGLENLGEVSKNYPTHDLKIVSKRIGGYKIIEPLPENTFRFFNGICVNIVEKTFFTIDWDVMYYSARELGFKLKDLGYKYI